ncbi:alpha/beta hydrolase [Rhodococcus ruber]|uniref:alpha/beta hydrolase n=1 Tax=Rhodococcus TaxID=1827 RepID=UPI00029B09D2|nr:MULTISPECIES: alpha/beta hydrolase [Rhodococcus]ATQ29337.1 alpha/beta hydrolase [Rhodococcus ruber]
MGIAQPNALYELYSQMAVRMAAEPPMDLPALRDMLEGLATLAAEPTEVTYEDVDAGGVHAILITPAGARTDRVIVYAHGGGCVTGSSASHRKMAAHLAKATGTRAVVPDFRLAPENPFPAQIEDLVTVHRWLRDQGYAPEATAVAGDSAGGNLSISTVLELRELGEPLPAAIVAFSPWLDLEVAGETMKSNADSDALISPEVSGMMAGLYLGETAATNALANPLYADLTGLPPLYASAGDAETLMDNAQRIVDQARAAGVETTLELQPGQQHVYVFMAGRSKEADETIANAGEWLKARFGR